MTSPADASVGSRCLHKCLIHLYLREKKKETQRKAWLDENHKWHTKFPWWIGPFTEINWIDAKAPRGAENCWATDEEAPSELRLLRAAGLIWCYIWGAVKLCWQALFVLFKEGRVFTLSSNVCSLTWDNSVNYCNYMEVYCVWFLYEWHRCLCGIPSWRLRV